MRKGNDQEHPRRKQLLESITAVSDRAVTVSGCKKIERYTRQEIRLRLCDVTLCVTGNGLTLNTFCRDELEIKGVICGITFEKATN